MIESVHFTLFLCYTYIDSLVSSEEIAIQLKLKRLRYDKIFAEPIKEMVDMKSVYKCKNEQHKK